MRYLFFIPIPLFLLVPSAWADGPKGRFQLDFALVSGLLLVLLLSATITAGRLMLQRRIPIKVHHFFAYTTALVAAAHAIYNLFFH